MKIYDPYKPLISIHIPKCAGSSFSKILESWFGPGFRRHYFHERKNRPPRKHALYSGLFRKKPITGLCIHGHFNNARGIGVQDYYPEADQLITIIRNPFDLHISNYFFLKRLSADENDDVYRDGKLVENIDRNIHLEDYLENSKNPISVTSCHQISQSIITNKSLMNVFFLLASPRDYRIP